MGAQFSSLAKVLGLSALGSALIKYGLPYGFGIGAIAPSNPVAVVAVLGPSLVMGGLLWWRSTQVNGS
ncbi:hypothetical protein NIES970_18290 [[Synechococcus] sp. NIES-970]|nr:hypothetical protein NIES970_18290 [[Synechococcus] sp. NIES-970]